MQKNPSTLLPVTRSCISSTKLHHIKGAHVLPSPLPQCLPPHPLPLKNHTHTTHPCDDRLADARLHIVKVQGLSRGASAPLFCAQTSDINRTFRACGSCSRRP